MAGTAAKTKKPAESPQGNVRSQWWEPLLGWLVTRVVCIAVMYAGARYLPVKYENSNAVPLKILGGRESTTSARKVDLPQYFRAYVAHPERYGRSPMVGVHAGGSWSWAEPLVHWDALWYLSIVEGGYLGKADLKAQQNVNFFPLYPLLIHGVMLLGLNSLVAALLIAHLSTLAAAYALYYFAAKKSGLQVARWTMTLWLAFPTAFFGCVPYADSLLAFFGVMCLGQLLAQKYVGAGVWGGLAAALRPPGMALGFAFAQGVFSKNRAKATLGAVLSFSGILIYFGYLWYLTGDFLLYPHVSRFWHDGGQQWNPIIWLAMPVQSVVLWCKAVWTGGARAEILSCKLIDGLVMFWALWHLPKVWKMGWGVFLGALAMIVLPLTKGTLASMSRYVWAIVPLFIVVGERLSRSGWRWWIVGTYALVQLVHAFLYGGGWEVI